ncbi:alkaline phosphatase [Parvularcula sp. IMCC14364]|uniref:alkaline phosphatase D family protein n=1 Tax=Parvularcula sp. IMCC14364 TaxID=3067902 RepID=UPI0027404AE5|nr:alkaline phosphatase D family protein [Parvularcula sp. IMCC14364]
MTRLTRRGFLSTTAGAAGAGLTACTTLTATAPLYQGEVTFRHGVASGDPLTDRVILWTRVTSDAVDASVPVLWQVYEDQALEKPVTSGVAMTSAARDYTVKVDATGLVAGQVYYYRFSVNTPEGIQHSATGRTRTLAASGQAPVRFAVVSCSNYPFGYFNVYREIGKQADLDAVIHLGDYIYEYGRDGYGGDVGERLGRNHIPPTEIISLADYRTRHAQYKSDRDLQSAHAAAPWLCTWDDHESTNNSYRTGAQNHNDGEGDWTVRKQIATQAYLEWMPVRDPAPGRARESIYRKFDFGDIATVFCLESRLTGRSDEISWGAVLADKTPAEIPAAAFATMQAVADPARTMLGATQENWLAEGLEKSAKDKAWQVLANQVIMAKVKPPRFDQTLTDEQKAGLQGFAAQVVGFSRLQVPWNLDAWDGFPAARERLYAAAEKADARLVTLTGDTHTAWANTLYDDAGNTRGVEFGTTSVSSPGLGSYISNVPDLGQQFADANREVDWFKPDGHGWMLVTLTKQSAETEYHEVSAIDADDYTTSVVKKVSVERS